MRCVRTTTPSRLTIARTAAGNRLRARILLRPSGREESGGGVVVPADRARVGACHEVVAGALNASLDVIEQEPDRRERLMSRVRRLRERLVSAGVITPSDPTQIISIVIGDNDRAVAVASAMQAQGFDVRAIRPPSVPQGTARLRISINASLSDDVIDRFADALIGVLKEVGACSTESS